jgi:NAD(P)-dependent dehydrogenase (short-subunit alcohol dehydrogenase family)
MPTVVVTGASTGIGEECALTLCKLGWRVFAGVRRTEDGEALRAKAGGSERLVPVRLDVTEGESIASAARLVVEAVEESGLDGLVNNAGIVVAGPLEFLPIDEFRRQMEVNVTGQVAVTQAFLPVLRKARGRIVNIGSISGRVATPMLGAYCASKFALDGMSSALRMELHPWGIHVAYISPTGIATPIWRKALAEADRMTDRLPAAAYTLYGPVIAAMRARAARADRHGLPVREVGKAVVRALTSSSPRTRYPVGRMASIVELFRILPDKLRERIILRQLRK